MKHLTQLLILPLLILLLTLSCKKKDVAPKDQLPPITQEGKGTMGFLINGKAWLPKGNNGRPNLDFYYDPSYKGGEFNLSAYKILSDKDREYFGIFALEFNDKKEFSLNDPEMSAATLSTNSCSYKRTNDVYREGRLTITRLDMQNRIVAGTFEFTLARDGCDTIKVTDGRFDMKF